MRGIKRRKLLFFTFLFTSGFVVGAALAVAQSGRFVADQKSTAGGFRVVEEDGNRFLELGNDFRVEDGPDLKVVLHRQATPRSYNRGSYVSLGALRRTNGRQRYRIPSRVDLSRFRSVVIWCEEFDVTFGHARINP